MAAGMIHIGAAAKFGRVRAEAASRRSYRVRSAHSAPTCWPPSSPPPIIIKTFVH